MNYARYLNKSFFFSMVLAAGLGYSGIIAHADKVRDQPLAQKSGEVELGSCRITGSIIKRKGAVYATFTCRNDSDKSAKSTFHFAAHETPGGSPMSRMMPMPALVKAGPMEFALKAGESKTKEILLRKAPERKPKAEDKNTVKLRKQIDRLQIAMNDPTWSLTVSSKKVDDPLGGGLQAFPKSGVAKLGDKPMRIAVTRMGPKPVEN